MITKNRIDYLSALATTTRSIVFSGVAEQTPSFPAVQNRNTPLLQAEVTEQ
jgi:hypothetical protein